MPSSYVIGDHFEAFIKQLRAANIAVYWVGLPIMRSPTQNEDAEKLNDVYRRMHAPTKASTLGVGFILLAVLITIPLDLLFVPLFAEQYGKGFRAEDVPHDDPDFLVALAATADIGGTPAPLKHLPLTSPELTRSHPLAPRLPRARGER